MNRHDCITMSLPDLGPAGSWGKGEHLKRLGDVHSDMVAPSTGSSRVGLATIRQARVGSERNAALWETLPVRIEHIRFVGSAGADEIVGADQTRRLAAAGGGEIISIEGADHLFSGSSASGRLADAVLGWLERT